MTKKSKITIVGLGYVGMSLAVLLGRSHSVVALDIDEDRVAQVNAGRPTVVDAAMEHVMRSVDLSLVATTDATTAYSEAEFIIVATPTDYDPDKNYFNTSSVEAVINQARSRNPSAEALPDFVMRNNLRQGFVGQDVPTRRANWLRPVAALTIPAGINRASSAQHGGQGQRGQRCELHGGSPLMSASHAPARRPDGSPDQPRLDGDRVGSGPRSQNRVRRPTRPRERRVGQALKAPL